MRLRLSLTGWPLMDVITSSSLRPALAAGDFSDTVATTIPCPGFMPSRSATSSATSSAISMPR